MMWAESSGEYHWERRNGSGERLRRIGPTWKSIRAPHEGPEESRIVLDQG
jgi:hypothetical protein